MYSGRDTPKGWVSPFGHPRINDCSHLPAAFRSVPRPSSPLGAKASTECPSLTPYPHHRPRTGPNHAPCNYQPVRAAAPAASPASRSNAARRCAPLTHTQNHLHHVKEHARPARHPAPSRGSRATPHERVSEVPPPRRARHQAIDRQPAPYGAGRSPCARGAKENGDGRIRTDDPLLAKQVLSH